MTIAYLDGSATGRQADVSVNGGTAQLVQFTPTGSFSTVGTMTIPLTLTAPPPAPCPRCGSADTRRTAEFSATACKSLHRCTACGEPFEAVKPI